MSHDSTTHIDFDKLRLKTESDVEQKLIMPLLAGDAYLGIPQELIETKGYLAPTKLDKEAGKGNGYFPDYSIWCFGFPVMIVEAKSPAVSCAEAYREASLYARHLNVIYPSGINPCAFVLACNGKELQAGHWDAAPEVTLNVSKVRPGSKDLQNLRDILGFVAVQRHAQQCLDHVRSRAALIPYEIAGGPALLNAKLPLNSFAANLSPILKKYFSNQEDVREIATKAYVNSAEVTEYDKVLESLLKERLNVQRNTVVQALEPGKRGEEKVARAISEFDKERPPRGHLQIIQGSVGSGKSLFVRRYHEVLQPAPQAQRTRWAFVDFNDAPPDISNAYEWLCRKFIEDFSVNNPDIDLGSESVQRGIFASTIQKRRSVYESLKKVSAIEEELARAKDLMQWQDDCQLTARGIADYVLRGRQEILVVVMDNVDRLDLQSQLHAFQLALSFLAETRSFVILQMRDETYERFKDQPPLDTFRAGITFHISPPRFVDVVKRRLELSLVHLTREAEDIQTYTLKSGVRIVYPKTELGNFLRELYLELFERQHNISRILEALAGHDVRRALEMFVRVITSGHLSEVVITSNVMSAKTYPIREHNVLRILMRTDYRFASEHSGVITNIFWFDNEWKKPDNFLIVEILYFLIVNRKRQGQIGLQGYWTCRHIAEQLQRMGYVPEDTLGALNYLLHRRLIGADHLNFTAVNINDSVKILAAGFMHLRFLPARLEYLFGILPTTPFFDESAARRFAEFIVRENQRIPDLNSRDKAYAVQHFYQYLFDENARLRDHQPLAPSRSGATLVLEMISNHLQRFWNPGSTTDEPGIELDIV